MHTSFVNFGGAAASACLPDLVSMRNDDAVRRLRVLALVCVAPQVFLFSLLLFDVCHVLLIV